MEMTENEQAKHGHGVIIWNILHRQLTFSTEQLQQTTEVAAVRVVPKKGLLLVIVSKDSVKAMNTINSHNFPNTSNHTRLVITTTWSKAFAANQYQRPTIHGHFIDLSTVVLFNVTQNSDVI